MARIRTVKPELFRHEVLFDLEQETQLPIRISWIGLFAICDREGRFKWRPRAIKSEILPYDEIDFSRVLHALGTRGLVVKYAWTDSDGVRDFYGCLPTFNKHQVINNRESPSRLPSLNDPKSEVVSVENRTCEARVVHASGTRLNLDRGEGKGREGKGTEELKAQAPPITGLEIIGPPGPWSSQLSMIPEDSSPTPKQNDTGRFIGTYVRAFQNRYGNKTRPDLGGKTQGQIKSFLKDVPIDRACNLIEVYLQLDTKWFMTKHHDFGTFMNNLNPIGVALDTGASQDPSKINWADIAKSLNISVDNNSRP